MANRKVTLLVRVYGGNPEWIDATPGPGPFYIRWCEGNRVRYRQAGTNFDDAEIAKAHQEKKLLAASLGFVMPEPESPANAVKNHRIVDAITAYIAQISKPDKNGECRPEKSIKATKSELERFHVWSKKTYIEELNRPLLERWRDELLPQYEPDTVVNKLMTVASFWIHNPVVPHEQSLLPYSEFPDKKVTIPDPYTEDEFDAMMKVASYEEGLLLYFFITTGMREQEIAHTEREDINWELGELHIVKKPKYGWGGKTAAAIRQIPLDDELLAELRLRKPGLLFPNASGQPHSKYLCLVERVVLAAGVMPTTAKPHMKAAGMVKDDWCHRFRDTGITNKLHFTKAGSMADMLRLCKQIGHADMTTLDKYFGRLKKPYVPKLRLRKATKKVVSIA